MAKRKFGAATLRLYLTGKNGQKQTLAYEENPHSGGAGYGWSNELLGCRISIRGQGRIGMDGRPAFFREASDICDHSV